MNLNQLYYFYMVAKENGFTNASKVLRIQQPAISRMVKTLEDDVGFRLFEKVGRKVQLTPQGKDMFAHCEKIFDSVEELRQSLGKISEQHKGPLVIGASDVIASHLIPGLISQYWKKFPLTYPSIFSGPSSMILEKILNGSIEFGMFFHLPSLPERLEVCQQIDVPFHLVVLKKKRNTKEVIETFIGSREIDDVSTRRFPTLERLRRDYPKASIRFSSNNLVAHKEMVLRGLGVSILPIFLVKDEIEGGLLCDLYPRENFVFKLKIVKRRSGLLSANAQEWMKMC